MSSFVESDVFELTGGREMVTAKRAAELLELVTPNDNVSVIRLSNKSFGEDSARLVAEKLSMLTNIRVADISDIIAGRHEDEALLVLKIISSSIVNNNNEGVLEEVNVSENALGQKGIIACKELLQVPSLKRLFFCNNGLSAEASELISETLLSSPALVNGALPFTTLHFYNNMSGEGGAKATAKLIEKCPNLENVRYSATRAGREGCAAIASALNGLTNLTHVDLADSTFGEENANVLAEALSKQPNLSHLNIRDGGLDVEGIEALTTALIESSPPLVQLDLSGNDATEESLGPVSELLAIVSSTLEEFIMDDSEIMDLDTIQETFLPSISKMTKLRCLSLCGCYLTAAAAVAIAKCVSSIDSFSILKLDGNEICEEGVTRVTSILLRSGKMLGTMDDNDDNGDNDLDDDDNDDFDEGEKDSDIEMLGAALSASNISS